MSCWLHNLAIGWRASMYATCATKVQLPPGSILQHVACCRFVMRAKVSATQRKHALAGRTFVLLI